MLDCSLWMKLQGAPYDMILPMRNICLRRCALHTNKITQIDLLTSRQITWKRKDHAIESEPLQEVKRENECDRKLQRVFSICRAHSWRFRLTSLVLLSSVLWIRARMSEDPSLVMRWGFFCVMPSGLKNTAHSARLGETECRKVGVSACQMGLLPERPSTFRCFVDVSLPCACQSLLSTRLRSGPSRV